LFTTRQISYFDWAANPQQDLFGKRFQDKLERVLRNRAIILNAPDTVSYETQQQHLRKADEDLIDARHTGDVLVAAVFSSPRPKPREKDRLAKGGLLKRAIENITDLEAEDEVLGIVHALRVHGVTPFHWELELPEVFRRGGFDVMDRQSALCGQKHHCRGPRHGLSRLAEVGPRRVPWQFGFGRAFLTTP
jgi:hypothetical protein